VACEMSSHELLITELVLRNTLSALQPAEIAALLSSFVYQGKDTGDRIDVTPALTEAIEVVKTVEQEITLMERSCHVLPLDPFNQEHNLNFDLVPIVYAWAREKVIVAFESEYIILWRITEQSNSKCWLGESRETPARLNAHKLCL